MSSPASNALCKQFLTWPGVNELRRGVRRPIGDAGREPGQCGKILFEREGEKIVVAGVANFMQMFMLGRAGIVQRLGFGERDDAVRGSVKNQCRRAAAANLVQVVLEPRVFF